MNNVTEAIMRTDVDGRYSVFSFLDDRRFALFSSLDLTFEFILLALLLLIISKNIIEHTSLVPSCSLLSSLYSSNRTILSIPLKVSNQRS